MYDSDKNPKSGVVCINLPTINQDVLAPNENLRGCVWNNGPVTWSSLDRELSKIEKKFPFLPPRVQKSIAKGASIPVANWNAIIDNPESLNQLIEHAFQNRKNNIYCLDPLQKRNR